MNSKDLYSTYVNNITGSNGTISAGLVKADRLDLSDLRLSLFPQPKVIKEPPPTIDQMVASALSRLKVFIEAECNWASNRIKVSFDELKYLLNCHDDYINILSYNKSSDFPSIGSPGVLYLELEYNHVYVWSGQQYVQPVENVRITKNTKRYQHNYVLPTVDFPK